MNENKDKFGTCFLFQDTNFLDGISSAFNIAGNFYSFSTSNTGEEADMRALKSDWYNVGEDIKEAKKKFEKQNLKELCLK